MADHVSHVVSVESTDIKVLEAMINTFIDEKNDIDRELLGTSLTTYQKENEEGNAVTFFVALVSYRVSKADIANHNFADITAQTREEIAKVMGMR